jgi:membrane protein implicated in regulation of membrane protease activity
MVVPAVGVLLAFFVLPPGWGIAVLVAVVIWEIAEKLFWLRLIRRYPLAMGRETLIGLQVTATTFCGPDGRVRLQGESWRARCSAGARPGEALVVEGVDLITLIVGKQRG